MTIKYVIEKLKKYNEDMDLYVFAEGKIYPVLDAIKFEDEIEIDCGWIDINKEKL